MNVAVPSAASSPGDAMGHRRPSFFGPAEWLSRDSLERIQLSKLRALVRRASDTTAYYQRVLDAARVNSGAILTLADYARLVPITRKEDLLRDEQGEQIFGTRLGVPPSSVRQINMTGGTSGQGQELHGLVARDVETTAAAHAWGCYLAGLRPGDMVLNTLPVGLSAGGQWIYRSLVLQGAVPLQAGMYDTERKLREMLRFRARALIANPAYLTALEGRASEMGLDLAGSPVQIILTAGEPFSVEWVRRTEEVWGARVFSWYGATQRITAATCERGAASAGALGMLHVPAQLSYLEVIDPRTGVHVADGEEGEIVFTFLESEASPILRFGSGDRGVFRRAESCACGRAYDGIQCGTIFRYDDMIKIKGVNVWPAVVDDVVFGHAEVLEYQGRVFTGARGREEVTVALEVGPAVSDDRLRALVRTIEAEVSQRVGLRVEVEVAAQPLPRFEHDQRKPRRWSDERTSR